MLCIGNGNAGRLFGTKAVCNPKGGAMPVVYNSVCLAGLRFTFWRLLPYVLEAYEAAQLDKVNVVKNVSEVP